MSDDIERVAGAIFSEWAKEEYSQSTWENVCSRSKVDGYPNAKKYYRMSIAQANAAIREIRKIELNKNSAEVL